MRTPSPAAGPPVRNGDLDLIAVLVAEPGMPPDDDLDEEHFALLDLYRRGPLSGAEFASEADLAVGVVRVLLGDLLHDGRLRAVRPVPPAELPDVGLLQNVISGLRAL